MPDSTLPRHMDEEPPIPNEDAYGAEEIATPARKEAVKAVDNRLPPCNFEAEKALLGAMMANNRVLDKIHFLQPHHFADPIHTEVFTAMVKQIEAGRKSDPITLMNFFEKNERLSEIGGTDYLVELAGSAVTIINAAEYGRIINEAYQKRELIHIGNEIVNNAYCDDVEATPEKQREWAEAKLFELSDVNEVKKARSQQEIIASTLKEFEAAYNNEGAADGLKTCLTAIDRILGGIPKTSLFVLAGRPGMGKTALAIAIAYKAAYAYKQNPSDDNGPTAFFSLEMGAEQLVKRLVSDAANVPHSMLRSGRYHDQSQYEEVIKATQVIGDVPMYIDDTPGLSVSDIKARLRNLIRHKGVKMCFIDYLTHIRPKDTKAPKVYQVEQITRDLKATAKELGVPIVLLCQLSRAVEQREDKRPLLSDLRDSGAIEQDADQVMFAYRKAYYLEREEPAQKSGESTEKYADRLQRWESDLNACKRVCEVIIAKNRHGNTGSPSVLFDGTYQRVADLHEDQEGMF